MSTELLGIDPTRAKALDFTLTDADLKAYDPGKFFTSTEMMDTVPPLTLVPTEDDLRVLVAGIPASTLLGLQKWPSGAGVGDTAAAATAGGATTIGTATGSFASPPSP